MKILKKFLKLLSIEIFVNSFKEKKQKRNSSNLFNYNTNILNKKKNKGNNLDYKVILIFRNIILGKYI